jgi:hypothetical protein
MRLRIFSTPQTQGVSDGFIVHVRLLVDVEKSEISATVDNNILHLESSGDTCMIPIPASTDVDSIAIKKESFRLIIKFPKLNPRRVSISESPSRHEKKLDFPPKECHKGYSEDRTLYNFVELEVPKDNDCAFHCLGVPREVAAQQLLENMSDRVIRQLVAPEIFESFVGLQLPVQMESSERVQELRKEYIHATSRFDDVIRRTKEALSSQLRYSEDIERYDLDTLSKKFPNFAAAIMDAETELKIAEQKIREYASSYEAFELFVKHCIAEQGRWLGYLRGSPSSFGRTSSMDAIAYLNNMQTVIWTKGKAGVLQVLHRFEPYLTSYTSLDREIKKTVNLLHTDSLTHFNLLIPI